MIEIVDYKAGNLTSVKRALDYLGVPSRITADAELIAKGERIVFPGVGAAGSGVAALVADGIDQAIKDAFAQGTPILGICLGTQIILSHSDEDGGVDCLGLIPGDVVRFELTDPSLKIPHMGWNAVSVTRPHPVLSHIRPGDEFYFVHAYYPKPASNDYVVATTEYETVFASVMSRDNLIATQFHPEKSGPVGLKLLENFSRWEGQAC